MKIKNCRGAWTTNQVVGIVIAVIGLVLIIGLGAKLFGFFITQEEKNAAELLESIIGKIDALKDGENNTFLISGVDDWYLVGLEKGEGDGECFLENCLCVCKGGDVCEDNEICKVVKLENVDVFTLPYDYEKILPGRESVAGVYSRSCIKFTKGLINLEVLKETESLIITHENRDSSLALDDCKRMREDDNIEFFDNPDAGLE